MTKKGVFWQAKFVLRCLQFYLSQMCETTVSRSPRPRLSCVVTISRLSAITLLPHSPVALNYLCRSWSSRWSCLLIHSAPSGEAE